MNQTVAAADVVVIGAGPIGIEIASLLKRAAVDYLHFEAGQIGATIRRWPRNTTFFSSPEWIAIAGIGIQDTNQTMITGEQYLSYMRTVVETFDLDIFTHEKVVSISRIPAGGFELKTDYRGEIRTVHCKYIISAIGDMSFPRTLGIPGEDLDHVTHYFQDPHDYFKKRLLIVGNRNSAMEAALRCWRAGAEVVLAFRGEKIDENRIVSRLYLDVSLLIKNRKIEVLPNCEVVSIDNHNVNLVDTNSNMPIVAPADFVYLATGFLADQDLYKQLGVDLKDEESKPVFNESTMETNIPDFYVAGTTTGGNQLHHKVFITTSHFHCIGIMEDLLRKGLEMEPGFVKALSEHRSGLVGNNSIRDYPLSNNDIE